MYLETFNGEYFLKYDISVIIQNNESYSFLFLKKVTLEINIFSEKMRLYPLNIKTI